MPADRYIAIAGPIGVGKTTLAQRLSERWAWPLARERFDRNPFLAEFYRRGHDVALANELYFLWSRFEQLRTAPPPGDASAGAALTDFDFAKGLLFAEVTLAGEEASLYRRLWNLMRPQVRRPDAVVYLTDTTENLLERIRRRGRPMEAELDAGYLGPLRDAYESHFAAEAGPVLRIDCGRDDPLADNSISRIEQFVAGLGAD